jgi:asparagine synthase (glutamine-hydrolysing)
MCGIIGQVRYSSRLATLPNLAFIAHRGPDGKGEWRNADGNIYFGHTRLAILEPSPAGHQPMSDTSGRFTITFNGEIYNHVALRSLMPGITWRGTSDTETLVELLAAKGIKALNLLKGMFAFALHDAKNDSVLLARDRLGIKPLWVRVNDGEVSFASEIRPLLKDDDVIPNKEAISEYIGFGRMPEYGEIFNGLHSLAPGSWMRLLQTGAVEQDSWWGDKPFVAVRGENKKDIVQLVRQQVDSSIKEHLISDVGVGAFLSGGIDSSIVTLMAGRAMGKRLKTFTVGFPQDSFDERIIARRVAAKAGSEHCELEVSKDNCLMWVTEAIENLDLPSVDAVNTYIVSKAVRQTGLKVALSGLGGDELFGGYPSFKNIPLLRHLQVFPENVRRQLIKLMPGSMREKLSGLSSFSTIDLTVNRRRFSSMEKLRLMGFTDGSPAIPAVPGSLDTMGTISWAEIYGYMIPMLLRDSDLMSMAVGLEIRVPFLDHSLVETVLCLSQKLKKGRGTKPLLVEAFRDELPIEVYNRPKQGFTLPMDEWMRGPLEGFTYEGLVAAADLLNLNEPLHQNLLFKRGHLHWTRVWKWSVLGHWLSNRRDQQMQNATVISTGSNLQNVST